jgi:hypothetical protein
MRHRPGLPDDGVVIVEEHVEKQRQRDERDERLREVRLGVDDGREANDRRPRDGQRDD